MLHTSDFADRTPLCLMQTPLSNGPVKEVSIVLQARPCPYASLSISNPSTILVELIQPNTNDILLDIYSFEKGEKEF
jgi:hypothetical protein